jgi:carbonic anhydrase
VALRRGRPRRFGEAGGAAVGGEIARTRGGSVRPARRISRGTQPVASLRTRQVLPPLSIVASCRRSRAFTNGRVTPLQAVLRYRDLIDSRVISMKAIEVTYRYEACGSHTRTRPSNSEAARRRLEDGNRAFAALFDGLMDEDGLVQQVVQVDPRDLGLLPGEEAAPRQRPFAAILGCSDARVPVELIFNEGPNDLFVIRVAGNGLGSEVLGSLKYAVENLSGSLKLIVVMGHSGCGAVQAAVDAFLSPSHYLPLAGKHSLRNILDRLLVVVHASARALIKVFGPDVIHRPGYRQALIETSVVVNAALAAYSIEQEIETGDPTGLRVAYGVYLLDTREVWTPRPSRPSRAGMAAAPRDLAEFIALGDATVRSERIASLVNSNP